MFVVLINVFNSKNKTLWFVILISVEKKSPVDDNGPGARPKEKKVKTTGPSKTDQGKAMEVDDKGTFV